MYIKNAPRRVPRRRRGFLGFGDDNLDAHGCRPDQVFNDTAGGCVSLDENTRLIEGGITSSGSGASSQSSSGILTSVLKSFFPTPMVPAGPVAPVSGGIGTGTAIAIAGGVVVLALVLSRRS